MSDFVRGDLYMASFGGIELPVAIVSRDVINRSSPILLVVPTIEMARLQNTDYDTFVVLRAGTTNLDEDVVLVCTHVQPIAANRLGSLIGRLPPNVLGKLDNALRVVFAL
jgi:mRNA interferase MazF